VKILVGILLLIGLALAALVLGAMLAGWWAVRRRSRQWSGPGVKRVRNEALDSAATDERAGVGR
jgi:uncharacterized membrane protein YphA (DoxX/SURF4 family)